MDPLPLLLVPLSPGFTWLHVLVSYQHFLMSVFQQTDMESISEATHEFTSSIRESCINNGRDRDTDMQATHDIAVSAFPVTSYSLLVAYQKVQAEGFFGILIKM